MDEVADMACTLDFAERLQDFRAVNTCLEMICSMAKGHKKLPTMQVNPATLSRIIESTHVRQLPSNRLYARQLLE